MSPPQPPGCVESLRFDQILFSVHMLPLGHLFSCFHYIPYHSYADDRFVATKLWMSHNFLQVTSDKTEILDLITLLQLISLLAHFTQNKNWTVLKGVLKF